MTIAVTSLDAYDHVVKTLGPRQAVVLEGLRRYRQTRGGWPTPYELFLFLQARDASKVHDLNAVRPRLTELKARRLVTLGDRRRCSVTGRSAFEQMAVARPARPQARLF